MNEMSTKVLVTFSMNPVFIKHCKHIHNLFMYYSKTLKLMTLAFITVYTC